ncbi:MAG: hypothetical protein NVS3B20_04830 [Polyangiales bacterium]
MCIKAFERGQTLRKSFALLEAQEQLRTCVRNVCPDVVKHDCASWLTEMEQSIPTVIISARDPAGVDLSDVHVSVDGRPLVDKLEGRAIPVNPGEHTFRYERAGSISQEQRLIINQAEKQRLMKVTLEPSLSTSTSSPSVVSAGSSANDAPPSTSTVISANPHPSTLPIAAGSFAVLGAVAMGSFVYFGLTGNAQLRDLRDTCAGKCSASAIDSVKKTYLFADVSLGVGLVSLGLSTYFFLTRPTGAATAGAQSFDLRATRSGGLASFSITF